MARILVNVVPNRLAKTPPTSGVHVLLRENADMSRENSVLLVPISRARRDLRGPRMYDALIPGVFSDRRCAQKMVRLTSDFRCLESRRIAKPRRGLSLPGGARFFPRTRGEWTLCPRLSRAHLPVGLCSGPEHSGPPTASGRGTGWGGSCRGRGAQAYALAGRRNWGQGVVCGRLAGRKSI